jgi:phosphoglycolate phosphatase
MSSPIRGRRHIAVFDLDGTLVDSLPDLAIALNKLLAEEGRRRLAPDEVRVMVGEGALRLVERAFAATGAPADQAGPALVTRFLAHYEGNAAEHTRLFPGAHEALRRLAADGWRLAVCTNKPYRPSMEILDALGVAPLFAAVLGGDSAPFRKPDPRHLAATLDSMGATPDEAVFVGDSPNDLGAARGLGVPVALVTFGYSRVPVAELGADALLDSFHDLPDALRRLAGEAAREGA